MWLEREARLRANNIAPMSLASASLYLIMTKVDDTPLTHKHPTFRRYSRK